ncbi:MAG: hypothetical protein OEW08_12730, partial [Gammaproteobacteria bacterium]|nr:hypothetical protein [Gammaproteobacteria bacterium]
MRAYPNIARVLLLGIFATGCAHVTPLGALPQKEEDFHLPARELVARFPAVEGLHGDHRKIYDKSLSLGDLQTLWGDAARRRYYWEAEVTKYTTLSGLGITVSHLLPPVALGTLVLTPMLLTPKPVQQYVWDKGEYRITGTFGKTLLHNEPQ